MDCLKCGGNKADILLRMVMIMKILAIIGSPRKANTYRTVQKIEQLHDVMKALSIMVSGGKIISRLSVFNSPGMNDKKIEKQETKIKKAAEKFAKSLSKRSVSKPPFSYLIWFSAFKASSVINKEGLPADYEFYKNRDYFIDCKLNALQKMSINAFTHFFRIMIDKGFV